MDIIDLKKSARHKLIKKICETQDTAEAAFHYQTWMTNFVLEWLDKNGYEVKKLAASPLIMEDTKKEKNDIPAAE